MTSISPCLWFDDNLEEAMDFYTKIFPGSSVDNIARYGDADPGDPERVLAADFTLDGLHFRGINGGPADFHFDESVSFSVACRDQSEVDYYWDSLTAGGEESQCGWLKDRYGLSWQIVPTRLFELLSDPDGERAGAAMKVMMGMQRIVVADLEAAADAVRPAAG
jgi:predicted 3-demethylubiquinone-9 3-methyltransferase (glyoxalase superfamily)